MLQSRLAGIDRRVRTELDAQGFKEDQIKTEKVLHMRFDGSDTALMMYVHLPSYHHGHS
jgi:N-methylhydantoinase A/oxoprolinase/acetone carboxylase beta subunit